MEKIENRLIPYKREKLLHRSLMTQGLFGGRTRTIDYTEQLNSCKMVQNLIDSSLLENQKSSKRVSLS